MQKDRGLDSYIFPTTLDRGFKLGGTFPPNFRELLLGMAPRMLVCSTHLRDCCACLVVTVFWHDRRLAEP